MDEYPEVNDSVLTRTGVSRRDFLKFCSMMAVTLALPKRYIPRIARALASAPRPLLVWLEFQDCAGCTEAFLRATNPSLEKVALEILSVNYHETIMAPAGKAAEKSLWDTVEQFPGQYLVVVEGPIPSKETGIYCTIGGRTALDIVSEVCKKAAATSTIFMPWTGWTSPAR